jgi:hypothetical protein
MNFNEAINNNYITDYQIWLPSIHENTELLDKDLSIYDIDEVIKSKCKFMYSCLVNNGSCKCIVYCTDTTEMKSMMDAIKILDDYYCLDYHMDYITSDVNHKTRDTRLKHFADSTKIELLFSVRILDECIDIPSCDSIFITYPSKSKIRTIQRLSRCTRTDPNNKFKNGNIFIWCDEYDKILETLSGIKEYDSDFRENIKLNVIGSHSHLDDLNSDIGVIDDKIFISNFLMEIKEFKCLSWNEKLDEVKKYIVDNKRTPNQGNKKYETHLLGKWLSRQKQNYNIIDGIMKNDIIYNKFKIFRETYKEYFISNEELWNTNLEKVKQYIDENNKTPSINDYELEIKKIADWLFTQNSNYKKKTFKVYHHA